MTRARTADSARGFGAWIFFVAICSALGWTLSAAKMLNPLGYTLAFGVCLVAAAVWVGGAPFHFRRPQASRLLRRFRRPFPLAFLALATLAFVGGVLYAPTNFDALNYRTPRVLHWLWEEQWHWIHTDFGRLNSRGATLEWVTAPMISLAGTDRWLFLINAICFAFLPGRVFAILTRLGASPRAAYAWMWILPSGYGFLLQSASLGSDLFGAIMAMGAFEFALRARRTGCVSHVWFSLIGAGAMTGSKAFNLLLLLPWAVAILPSLRLLMRRPAASVLALALAASASMIPTAILNVHYCGDWTGLKAEPVDIGSGPKLAHAAWNSALLTVHNFAPPVFPFSGAWDRLMSKVVSDEREAWMLKFFEPGAPRLWVGELQQEEMAGLGLGVSILLVWIMARQARQWLRREDRRPRRPRWEHLIMGAAWVAFGVFMAKSGLQAIARYLLPFYLLLAAPILVSRAARDLALSKAWRAVALAAFCAAGLLLILTPPRPLWPALTVLKSIGATTDGPGLKTRVMRVYSVYRERQDAFRAVTEALPPGASPLGVIFRNDPETSLWKPLGSRRVAHLRPDDPPALTRQRGIRYVLISVHVLENLWKQPLDEWLRAHDAVVVRSFTLRLLARRGGETEWRLVRVGD